MLSIHKGLADPSKTGDFCRFGNRNGCLVFLARGWTIKAETKAYERKKPMMNKKNYY